jgi:hypothetical protein
MKNLPKSSNFSRPRTLSLAFFALGLLVFMGCKAPDASRPETNTPLGCNKQEGRYFDPATGVCVSVTSAERAYSLNNYRYVNKLEAEGMGEVEFVIYFSKYLNEEQYIGLMKDLRKVQVKDFSLHFTDSGDNTGGNATGLEINDDLVKKGLQSQLDWYAINGGAEDKQAYISSLLTQYKEGKFVIGDSVVTSTPTLIKTWWDRHRDLICSVQPRIDWLDKAQLTECKPWENTP